MISWPDFKEKQILFVQAEWGQKCTLRVQNENIVFAKNDIVANRASCHKVFAVFVVGDIAVTTRLIKESGRYGISLFFLDNNFEVYGNVLSRAEGNYLLRMKQYSIGDKEGFEIARKIVLNKVANQMALLSSIENEDSNGGYLSQKIKQQVLRAKDNKTLLGLEGNCSKYFFKTYLSNAKWRRRAPRTKEDIPNLLMDIGYTYLFNFVDSLLRLYGFDTYKGYYHKLFFARRSLACDIEEPFRCLVDRQIRKAYNLGQINESDFDFRNGQYSIPFGKSSKYTTLFLDMLMKNKEDIFTYVHDFYRFAMNPENKFPYFRVRVKRAKKI